MICKFRRIFPIALLSILITSSWSSELPKPGYARTLLKVARSLPGETEEVKVRTSEGNFATLIVKRRDKSGSFGTFDEHLHPSNNATGSSKSTSEEHRKKAEAEQAEGVRLKLNAEVKNHSGDKIFQAAPIQLRVIDENKNWTPLNKDGKVFEVEEEASKQWKPVNVQSGETGEGNKYENRYDNLVFARDSQIRARRKLGLNEPALQGGFFSFLPLQPRPLIRTNIGANTMKNRDAKNVPPEVTIRSEINVKSLPKRSPMTMEADGTPVIHGRRVPDEPIDKLQVWRNARVINNKLVSDSSNQIALQPTDPTHTTDGNSERQRFERFFDDVNRRYGKVYEGDNKNVYFEWDPKNYRNEVLKADVYDTRNENYRSNLQKRMLHPESTVVYPNSKIYTPENQKIAPLTLKPGVRTPVLQYAHPELGVQAAKIVKNEKRRPDNFPENQHSFTEQRHKKKYVLNDRTIVDSYSVKNYYPNQHFYGLKRPNDTPFWVKLSENFKNQLSTGVEKVSQLTKPVFDPLVEATHKISQNLGLSKKQDAQEKIGTIAATPSILIPALGLVASGAALGIGAVAVGRYLDVDVLKRSNDADSERTYRAMYVPVKYVDQPEATEFGSSANDGEKHNRRKRDADDFEASNNDLLRSKRLDQRKGADYIDEIVEIDIPADRNVKIEDLLALKKKLQSEDSMMMLIRDESASGERDSAEALQSFDKRQKRVVRNTDQELNDALQNLENAEIAEVAHIAGDWENTPCAKRIFCDAMIQEGSDAAVLMEKKMAALLGSIQPNAAALVSSHFEEVMDAVRRHNCSSFLCPQARPGNIFF